MGQARTYTYEQVADLIQRVLGVRPALSTLRAAAAKQQRSPASARHSRLTAGMPAPYRVKSGAPSVFLADEIDAWLNDHPQLRHDAAREQLLADVRAGRPESLAVDDARSRGMSWAAIASTLQSSDGRRRSRQGMHQAYQRRQI